ncbi:MAG: tetratricopeptide repeat protein [Bacteroidia bacterium]
MSGQKLELKRWAFVLVILIFISFGRGIKNDYSIDDYLVTTEANELVSKGIKGIPEILTSPYQYIDGQGHGYRPLAKVTYAIEYELWGFRPKVSHLINIALYALAVILLFFLLKNIVFSNAKAAFLVAALFALHPLHSEVVFNIKNREELLALLFGFTSFYCLWKGIEKDKFIKWAGLALFVFAIGTLAKITIIIYGGLIPFVLVYTKKVSLKKGLLILGLYVSVTFIMAYLHITIGADEARTLEYPENFLVNEGWTTKLANAFNIFNYYGINHIWPLPLLAYYGTGAINPVNWSSPYPYLAIVVLVGMLYGIIKGYKNNSTIGLGFGVYLIGIILFLNFPLLAAGVIAERFATLSVLGFVLVLYGVGLLAVKNPIFRNVAFFAVITFFTIANINRAPDWKDQITLVRADVAKAPNSIKLNMLVAEQLHLNWKNYPQAQQKEIVSEAAKHYLKAIELWPESGESYSRLGILCMEIGQVRNAIDNFAKAINKGKNTGFDYYLLASAFDALGDYKEALKHYKTCLAKDPGFYKAKKRVDAIKQEIEQVSGN